MNTLLKMPFYARASLLIVGLYVFVSTLYIGQGIILPFIYATIIAVSVSPVINFMVRKGVNRTFSIFAILATFLLIACSLLVLLLSQVDLLSEAWPQLKVKFEELIEQTVIWASVYFKVDAQQMHKWVADVQGEFMENGNSLIGMTISTMGGLLPAIVLTPVYIFMLLFYQPHLIKFTHQLFGVSNDNNVSEVLTETKTIIQSYLVGLFLEFVIVAVLNSVGLLILGFDYAILLGVTGACLNVIPYLGGVICMGAFMLIALITKSPIYVLYVVVLYSVIQFIDNNLIVPKVVGSKVKLNALVCVLVVILGAALWGIPGMFLSIPVTAIIKLILDRIESLKPWGFLLGDTMPPMVKLKIDLKEVAKKLPKIPYK